MYKISYVRKKNNWYNFKFDSPPHPQFDREYMLGLNLGHWAADPQQEAQTLPQKEKSSIIASAVTKSRSSEEGRERGKKYRPRLRWWEPCWVWASRRTQTLSESCPTCAVRNPNPRPPAIWDCSAKSIRFWCRSVGARSGDGHRRRTRQLDGEVGEEAEGGPRQDRREGQDSQRTQILRFVPSVSPFSLFQYVDLLIYQSSPV